MFSVFAHSNFNGDISSWDVSNVVNLGYMFKDNKVFDQNLNKWNVEKVKQFNCMFENAIKYNHDISRWKVDNVIDMTDMFKGAESFDRTLCGDKWSENRWTLIVESQVITEVAGAIVSQGSATAIGILVSVPINDKTIGETTKIIIKGFSGRIFVTNVDLVVGSTTVKHDTITARTNNNAFADSNGRAGCCDIGSYMEKPYLSPFVKTDACAVCPVHLFKTTQTNSYPYCPSIQDLVKMWMNDETGTEKLYGHIKDWDTSEVLDMEEIVCGHTQCPNFNIAAKEFNADMYVSLVLYFVLSYFLHDH